MFRDGAIEGVIIRELARFEDTRGWLAECFRHDELPPSIHPAMGYASLTLPGTRRGPHEHVSQTDVFTWVGPGTFLITLWDNRSGSPTFRNRHVVAAGVDRPLTLIVPPGVVHCYRCLGPDPGLVLNFPNRLYRGPGRTESVDEVRHEDDPDSPFGLDEAERADRLP